MPFWGGNPARDAYASDTGMAYAARVTPATVSPASHCGRYATSQCAGGKTARQPVGGAVGGAAVDARGGAGMAPYSPSSCTRASARALRCSADTAGKERCKSLIAEVTTSATTARVTHLWSAGTIYHGAHSVLVALRASSNAC